MKQKLFLSLIIPTHNRAKLLSKLFDNLFLVANNISCEIIVVDNNSNDSTKEIVNKHHGKIKYIFEKNTSFTKARHTGAEAAEGDIIVYLDDDVIVKAGTFEEINRIFIENPNCAVAGGRILPHYEQTPPEWVANLQKSFNGFSLYNLGNKEKKVDAVPGPIMAIRKTAFDKVGGFPPDTIGVETNQKQKTFKKLYIGLGDYGFCSDCRRIGYDVLYSPKIEIEHLVPKIRLTKDFWESRMAGEGQCLVIARRKMKEFKLTKIDTTKRKFHDFKKIIKCYIGAKIKRIKGEKAPLLPEELWVILYKSLYGMEQILIKNPGLDSYLWNLGLHGVSDNDFEKVLTKLPPAYKKLAL
jgi:glucosyl-dolichyl phosphate glucuronosyltransferase